MDCKNCDNSLRTDFSFCPDCGAKVIRNRLTPKNLWHDVTERYFNLDNTFLKTFTHLFTKPEVVIEGYIGGIRKKYLNPISYFGIAITLSGILVFIIKNFFIDSIGFNENFQGATPEFANNWKDITFDYSSLFFISYIPLITIAAFLIFNKKKLNFTEHFIIAIYILAHYSIVSFPASLTLMLISPESYMTFSKVFMVIVFLYFIYTYQRVNRYKAGKLILKSVLFTSLIVALFFILLMIVIVSLFATGVIDPSNIIPPNN